MVRLIIDGYTMDTYNGVLFPGIAFPVDTRGKFRWHRQDVKMYAGHRAHIEIIDDGNGWVAVDEIRFNDANSPKPPQPEGDSGDITCSEELAEKLADCAKRLD